MVQQIKIRFETIEPENKNTYDSNRNLEGHVIFYWRKNLFQLWGKP